MHQVLVDSRIEIFHRRLHGSANRIKWRAHDAAEIARHLGLPTVGVNPLGNMKRVPPPIVAVTKADSDTGGSYTFTISDGTVDRMGDTIDPNGWVLQPYTKNPQVLWVHDSDLVPVGKATKVWVEAGRLKATMRFVPGSTSPEAERVKKLVDGGFLCATSVGFIPLKYSFSKDPNREFGIDFQLQELLEFSIVPVPANPNCLVEGKPGSAGKALPTPRLDEARAALALLRRRVRP